MTYKPMKYYEVTFAISVDCVPGTCVGEAVECASKHLKEKFGLDVGMKNMTSCVIMKEGKR